MINTIKKNIILILPIILIIYFSLNLLGGNRGLFAYLDKKDQFENLLEKKKFLTIEITKVIEINLTSTFLMCKHSIKKMLKNKSGKIVNITSVVGHTGNVGQANYTASKAGIVATVSYTHLRAHET